MRRARPPVLKAYRHGRFAPCGLDKETLVLGVREILLRSYETSTEDGARSAREQRLANLPAVTDPAGSQYGRTLRTLQHLRKQFVEYGAGLDVTASFDALTHKIIGAQIQRRLSADCACDLNAEFRSRAPHDRNHLLRRQPPGEVQGGRSGFENGRKRIRLERQDIVHRENSLRPRAYDCHGLARVFRSETRAAKDSHCSCTRDGGGKVGASPITRGLEDRILKAEEGHQLQGSRRRKLHPGILSVGQVCCAGRGQRRAYHCTVLEKLTPRIHNSFLHAYKRRQDRLRAKPRAARVYLHVSFRRLPPLVGFSVLLGRLSIQWLSN